jgi:UDP-N-acetylmuramoylalanine--D-glutamate ligase
MNKYKGKKIALLGYGLEGRDTLAFLTKQGADITIYDQNENVDRSGGEAIPPSRWKTGEKYLKDGLKDFDYIVRSPGVYRYMPEIVEAEKAGVKITSAIKIFFDECPGKIIGITGTKGKGTTSTLIYEILKVDGCDVYLAGNIGKPMLELLPILTPKSYIILEMSSFQLIDMDVSPDIAVVLNITEDHLDWHKNRGEYVGAKKNIVRYQSVSDWAVINDEYQVSKSFGEITKGKIVFFSKKTLDEKFKEKLLLRGEHNLENIAAAVAVAKIVSVDEEKVLKTVRSFKGLEHRLELVDTVDGVTFYNDSFATAPQPTIAAINSFTEPETLILGGSDKGLDYQELGEVIKSKSNIKNIILIGTTADKIKNILGGENLKFEICHLKFAPMEQIVEEAYEVSDKGSVVILSPASASFDMFKNYKDRGNQFKEAVRSLHKTST